MPEITIKQRLMILGACFLLVALFLMILFGDKGFYDYMFLKKQYKEIETENEVIDGEGRRVYEVIKRLRTDLDYVEEIARQQLGMIKENEVVYQFPNEESPKENPGTETSKMNTGNQKTETK